MTKSSRNFLLHSIWLAISIVLTILILIFLFRWDLKNLTIDFHIHDTYLVIYVWHLIIPLFLKLTFFIFFIKEMIKGFTDRGANFIILLSGFLAIVFLGLTNKFLLFVGTNINWTIYPLLSGLESETNNTIDPGIDQISNLVMLTQFVILALVIIVSYKWGRNNLTRNS